MEFYYFEDDTRKGPYSANELVELAHKGDITPMTMVEAGSRRVQALKIKGLFTSQTPSTVLPDDQKPVYPPQIGDLSASPSEVLPGGPQTATEQPVAEIAIANFNFWCRFAEGWGKWLRFFGWFWILLGLWGIVYHIGQELPFDEALSYFADDFIFGVSLIIAARVVRFFGSAGFYWLAKNGDLDERTKLKRR